jgi:hypothetical protein
MRVPVPCRVRNMLEMYETVLRVPRFVLVSFLYSSTRAHSTREVLFNFYYTVLKRKRKSLHMTMSLRRLGCN